MTEQSRIKFDTARLIKVLQNLQKSLECIICMEIIVQPMKTRCGHSFCHSCIKKLLQNKSAHCPLCNKNINRRSVSKDDHLETYIDKFNQLVIAIETDTHIDILSRLKQSHDTKESCSYSNADEYRDSNRKKRLRELPKSHDLSPKLNRLTDVPSTSRGVPINYDDSQNKNNTYSSNKKSSKLSNCHPFFANKKYEDIHNMPDVKCRTWLHTFLDVPMNNTIDTEELSNVTNDDERESDKTCQSTDKKCTRRIKQVRKRFTNNIDDTSQMDKKVETRQFNKVRKIDSTSELKYNASHARIRANSKCERNAAKLDEQEEIQEINNWESSSSINDQKCQSLRSDTHNRSILDSTGAVNDRQFSTDWSRVIEIGKEMRPKSRKVKKLNVNIEKKKDPPRIIENVMLTPSNKYALIEDIARHNVNRKKTEEYGSNLLEPESRRQANDKNLSNIKLTLETSNEINSREHSFNTDSLNHSADPYIMLEEGKEICIKNLNNDQVNQIIGSNIVSETWQDVNNQHHKENKSVTAKHCSDSSQRHKLIVLTPEKLNRSVNERRVTMQTSVDKFESSLVENHTPECRVNRQNISEKISSFEVQSFTPSKLSLRRKMISGHKNTDASPSKQIFSSDKSSFSKHEKDTSNRKSSSLPAAETARLSHRLTTVRCDLSSQMLNNDQTPIKECAVSLKKVVKNNNAKKNISVESLSNKLKNINDPKCGFSVKFMQLGTMIRRRYVKYFYLGSVKCEQSLPANIQVASVYNMQQSISRYEIKEQVKLHSLVSSSNIAQLSNDSIIMENISSIKSNSITAKTNETTNLPLIYEMSITSTPKNIEDPNLNQKNVTPDRVRSTECPSVLTNQSNKSIQDKCHAFMDNNVDRTDQRIPRTLSEKNSIKLLSPDKDSQLKFLAMDSAMSEYQQIAGSTRQQSELAKEYCFAEKSFRSSISKTQELSSESSEFIRSAPNNKRKRMKRINDDSKSDSSTSLDDDSTSLNNECTIKLNHRLYNNESKKEHSNTSHERNDEVTVLDCNKQDACTKKYKRIIIFNSDTESESPMHNKKSQKRFKTDVQENVSIVNTPEEKRIREQDTDGDLRIRNIVNKWSSEHNATQKELIKKSRSTQGSSKEKPINRQSSYSINSPEIEKHNSVNKKNFESNLFESNSIFGYSDNVDRILQQARSQTSQKIADPSNEDIINKVLQIDQSTPRNSGTSQGERSSRERLLHDNFDEIIANVELPPSENATSQIKQPSRNLRHALTQQKTLKKLTNEPRDATHESPIMISLDDMFEHCNDLPGKSSSSTISSRTENIVPGRFDEGDIATHNRENKNAMEVTRDFVNANDKDTRRMITMEHNASYGKKTTSPVRDVNANKFNKERNVSARSVSQLRLDDNKTQEATVASNESTDDSFEDDTLMNVTQHQAQLQIFEEDLFGIPASQNGSKATKAASQDDPSREKEGKEKNGHTTQHKKVPGDYSTEEDDVVENTPERKMKNSGNNMTAIKSRKNIAMLYSPISNQINGTPSMSGVFRKVDTPKSDVSTPMSRLREMRPIYQSTPKVTHAPAAAIKCHSDVSTESKKTGETAASGSILSTVKHVVDNRPLENTHQQLDVEIVKKLCFVCSGLTAAQIGYVKEFAKCHNANYMSKFESSVTHVIVNTIGKENVTKSTLKYLQGIAYRKWIVSYRWIEDCSREQKLLDEEPYEATMHCDGINETGPRNSRLREKGLFEGFTFLCVGPYMNVTLSQYQDLLLATGAAVVDSLEALALVSGLRGIVIQDNIHADETIELWYQTAKAAPIIVDWIVGCIGQYKLFKLSPYIQCLSLQDFCDIGYPRELVEDEEYSDDETDEITE